jgi:gliding motility-associated-like protein
VLLLAHSFVFAQNKASPVWIFGHNAGLDFTSAGNPTPVQSAIFTHSAKSATQCDAQGNVLFYANGLKIWDKQGNVMPGSQNPGMLSHNSSWTIQARIVPDPVNTNRYYVFNLFPSSGQPPFGPESIGQLTYTIVDLSLNGGLGAVVTGSAHILIDTNTGSYMDIVPDDACNLWLLVQSGVVHTFNFKAYKISPSGVSLTPVVSPLGFLASALPAFPYGIDNRNGQMIYSYTRNKIFTSYNGGDLYAFSFDPSTGKVSNPNLLGWNYAPTTAQSMSVPGICLSPDESMLYTCGYTVGSQFELRQYPIVTTGSNVSLGPAVHLFNTNSAQYVAVMQQTSYVWNESDVQRGPDNKIYVAFNMGQDFLGVIDQPDLSGPACNFNPKAVTLLPGTFTTNALPAPVVSMSSQIIAGSSKDTIVCFGKALVLTAPDNGYTSYVWHDGHVGKTYTATKSGTYIVKSSNSPCVMRTDTFNVKMVDFTVSLGEDLSICNPATLHPVTNAVQPFSYLWSDASTGSELQATQPGKYWVQIIKDGCSTADTINISKDVLSVSLPDDTVICKGDRLTLDVSIDGATYTWQDGSNRPTYIVEKEGLYSVLVRKGICEQTADVQVQEELCSCHVVIPSAFSPNGDGRNDNLGAVVQSGCPINYFLLSIYNRWGQLIFTGVKPTDRWDGKFKGLPADAGTYMYYLEYAVGKQKKQFQKGDITIVR